MPRPKKPGGPGMNRTDLQSVPTGRGYGARTDYEAAASTPAARAASAPPQVPGAGGGIPPAGGDLAAALQSFSNRAPVGLGSPTSRPGEPVTQGLPSGPGLGPEAVPGIIRQGPNPDVNLWRNYMPMLELMASRPEASSEMRQWYRRLRAQMPADPYSQPQPG